jgi:predicted nuclease of predicted toxin-antitoxin system
VRLWIDECLSPTLVAVAQGRYEATCNEYRGMLHATDRALFAVLSSERWVLVTNNEADFRGLTRSEVTHPGLVVLPQRTRAEQATMLASALEFIERSTDAAGTSPAAWMTNKVVEYHDISDTLTAHEWPPSRSG